MAAPLGNQNAARAKLFHDALKRALARSGGSVDKGLNKVCDKLVDAALAGEQWAIKEVADRVEGKPAQSLSIGNDEDKPFKTVTEVQLVPLHDDSTDSTTE